MNRSESIDQIVTALAKAKADMKTLKMSGQNTFFTSKNNPKGSKYSTNTDLFNGTNEALSKNGLVIYQDPYKTEDGRIGVKTYLFHNSGQWLQNDGVPLKPDKDTPQGYASALTYSKRQEQLAILCLAGEEDDDGNEAEGNDEGESKVRPVEDKKPIAPKPSLPSLYDSKNQKHKEALEALVEEAKLDSSKIEHMNTYLHGTPYEINAIKLKLKMGGYIVAQ